MPKAALAIVRDSVESAIAETRARVAACEAEVSELRQRIADARATLAGQHTLLADLRSEREAAVLGHGTLTPSELGAAIREASAAVEDQTAMLAALDRAEAQAVAELREADEALKEFVYGGWFARYETLRENLMHALLTRWPEYAQAALRVGTLRWRLAEALGDLATDGRLAAARDKMEALPTPDGLGYQKSRLIDQD